MDKNEELFRTIGRSIGGEEGKLFGKACFKVNGKAFVCFFEGCMVFKLNGELHQQALALPGARLFDPSVKGRPMKEWVQVPAESSGRWQELAKESMAFVGK